MTEQELQHVHPGPVLRQWLVRRVRAKWVKWVGFTLGGEAPYWSHSKGERRARNGRHNYQPSISEVYAGIDWFIANFPAAWSRYRLLGEEFVEITQADVDAYFRAEACKVQDDIFNPKAAANNVPLGVTRLARLIL